MKPGPVISNREKEKNPLEKQPTSNVIEEKKDPLETLPTFDVLQPEALPYSEYRHPVIIREGYEEIKDKVCDDLAAENLPGGLCIFGHPGSGEHVVEPLLTLKTRPPVYGIS
jgi:hypothetical protein